MFPFDIFVRFPILAFIVAIVFAVVFYRKRRLFILLAAIAWFIYGCLEISVYIAAIPGDPQIRVDLLLIYPFLFLITTIGIGFCLWPKRGVTS